MVLLNSIIFNLVCFDLFPLGQKDDIKSKQISGNYLVTIYYNTALPDD